MMFRAAIVHKSLREITPRRALDRANATGQWFKVYIPIMPRRGRGFKSEAAASAAITRYLKQWPPKTAGNWFGLVWSAGRENDSATTLTM